ncbi:MAG: ATP synthase F1 subunit delta [Acidobacteria bacterium]|nr:ATP synthase F1 subunit delta [Acidobacteriota bacterium]
MPSAIALRYARALVDVVTGPAATQAGQEPRAIAAQLSEFADLLKRNGELQIIFSTPAVSTVKKQAVLSKLAADLSLAPLTKNFLNVVIQHGRMNWLLDITEAFTILLDERLGIVVAEVTTARPLADDERQGLATALESKMGKQVRIKLALDPTLIGGVTARVGSTIYDGSVRGQLERLRTDLVSE